MAILRIGAVNVLGLGSRWKQGHLLNDFRSLCLDVVAISETRVAEMHSLALLLDDYEAYASFGWLASSGVAVMFRKGLELEVSTLFLDPDGRVVVLDVGSREDDTGAFRLVAVYAPTGAGRPDFFRPSDA